MHTPSPEQGNFGLTARQPRARLRILETTDLHMRLLGYDYFTDKVDHGTGLIHLADRISAMRAEAGVTTLLFDNGDFIQGNPLADFLANQPAPPDIHPMIAAFNTLRYDGVTLGNHEFNYGLPFLRTALDAAEFPVICANIRMLQGPDIALDYVILNRTVTCTDGTQRPLRIGVTGFVPPQITSWDRAMLAGQLQADDIVATARILVPQIKAAGADLVVALCHSGIGAEGHTPNMENAAVPLAAVDGIDVILTGHTHEIFPGGNQSPGAAINHQTGTLHGKPTVMAGFYGNWLGVIDLDLTFGPKGAEIVKHVCRMHQEDAHTEHDSPLTKRLRGHVKTAHKATQAYIRQPIAETKSRLHSYFSCVRPDLSQQLLADAQMRAVQKALASSAHRNLPVLSATAPFRFGGRAGPAHFIDIAPGPVALRDAAAIYPFANVLCAVRRSGAQLRAWLEWSAAHFNQMTPGKHDQTLINPQIPAYDCDSIFGLTYAFDLSQPACFGPGGAVLKIHSGRVRDLRYQGKPVADDDMFVVAMNSYRANGGGGFLSIPDTDLLHSSVETTHEILIADLRARTIIAGSARPPWVFNSIPDTSAVFRSSPSAKNQLSAGISHVGPDQEGFDLYRLTF
ncbi:bifunctional 2',3'-cyclic-nucleotide 2'-phosphodiesterase/3'-nucleotidase [Yoonia sp.]|uniref:bifunctional 2',3'-cyclic-nucleotide 2'-phosphodiesterase/3'-nucleotidase n=1 Tax=Yoonia sp. TaxID=2212373 RepID=UPI0019EF6D1B|nr:bifunctional 2',3'-cyclic-nucleotide 2'-phosphodiesterase/3'-nucleotidase [Yoonia sp.]MBE0412191.1 bifunctional 2',3'-cyclic-nucleotide 2'-phosphodiesterase/3'-nucleotidase [Yoonia sp.]